MSGVRILRFKHRFLRYVYGKKISRFNGITLTGFLILRTFLLSTILIASFIFLLSRQNINTHIKALERNEALSLVSSKDKPGVTSPEHTPTNQNPKDGNKQNNAMNITKIPTKPNWVKLPLFIDPLNSASQYLPSVTNPEEAKVIGRLSKTPVAQWFGDWNTDVTSDVANYTTSAKNIKSIPVVVAYNIPNRDCGGYSIGGSSGLDNYINWVQKLANGIGNNTTVVILEPDALGALDCLPKDAQKIRLSSISQAVNILKKNNNTSVYIDAGTPVWQPLNIMASRLKDANVESADGFSLNVSYFATTAQNQDYGDKLSKLVGYKHYVIDTSRNGGNNQVTGMHCNPGFASYGESPTTNINNQLNDALLWIKIPWESDGPCNGSPGPGQSFWPYALQLAKNAGW